MKLNHFLLVSLALLVAACTFTQTHASVKAQPWMGFDKEHATLMEYSGNVPSIGVDFDGWRGTDYVKYNQIAKIEINGGQVLVGDNSKNVIIFDEKDSPVDFTKIRLDPGTYIFKKTDTTKEWSFSLNLARPDSTVSVHIIFASPLNK